MINGVKGIFIGKCFFKVKLKSLTKLFLNDDKRYLDLSQRENIMFFSIG